MTKYTLDITPYVDDYVVALKEILTRMNWSPVQSDNTIIISVPDNDAELFEWIMESDLLRY